VSNFWYNAAAWVQAIGTIAAVIGSAWFAARDSRAARRNAEEAKIAAKTAALNLAILAYTHVRQLHQLLRDEARRGRLNHISPSRTFLAQQQMLTGFPIESLEDPDAMVAFSFFPGALSMAADLYAHLEEAVRAEEDEDPVEVFTHYAEQLATIEDLLRERLEELRAALKLPDKAGVERGATMPNLKRRLGKTLRPARHAQKA
jgi:fatty acid-binding protein DegV